MKHFAEVYVVQIIIFLYQSLSHVVLDEADQMLERGFSETVEEILSASYRKDNISLPQMMLFSG